MREKRERTILRILGAEHLAGKVMVAAVSMQQREAEKEALVVQRKAELEASQKAAREANEAVIEARLQKAAEAEAAAAAAKMESKRAQMRAVGDRFL
jgi:hypothetical protein